MATRLIGTDDANPRLPALVIAATQGTTAADLAPGDVLDFANAYTDEAIADITAGGVDFATDAETIAGTATTQAVTPAGLNAALPFVDVRSYGAVGDGVADDTAALQAAIDSVALGAAVPAVTVMLPPGTYKITSSLVIERRAVKLLGVGVGNPPDFGPNPGQGTTLKWGGSGGDPMIYVEDAAHVRIADILFQGRDAPNQPSEGIFFDSTVDAGIGTNSYIVVERCWFGYFYGLGVGGSSMDYCLRWGGLSANNDQFVISNCQFYSALIANVQLDETQSVWGTFYDCTFAYTTSESGRKGLVTSSSTTLVNPQFDGCNPDIEINSSAQVIALGMQSERSEKVADINPAGYPDHGGRLIIRGGYCILSWIDGTNYIDHREAIAGGGVDIDGMRIHTGSASPRPKIKIRGVAGAAEPGFVSLRNTGDAVADLDVVAPASGDGILVQVDDGGVFDRKYVSAGATYTASTYEARIAALGYLNQATADSLYVNTTGDTISGTLYVDPAALWVRGGINSYGNPQLILGQTATHNYRHEIVTNHDAGTAANNSIMLKVWKPGDPTAGTPSTTALTVSPTAVTVPAALDHDGTTVGFYGTTPVAKQTGVPVTIAGVHAALVNLGLIGA